MTFSSFKIQAGYKYSSQQVTCKLSSLTLIIYYPTLTREATLDI